MITNADSVVGTVKGPGDTPNQYIFITSDNRQVRVGDFVYYSANQAEILGKIACLELVDHLPDRIFADTSINPNAIASLVGFFHPNPEIYAVTVDVIGYFDPNLGFMNPRRAPIPGSKVFLASDARLQTVLNRRRPGAVGGATLGSLLLRSEGAVPVVLDVKELVSTHLAILAGTGSGKSYTAGVLIEELLLPNNRAAVLVFDPHGEYHTLSEMRGHSAFAGADGYQPTVNILTPDDIRIRVSSLTKYDLLTLLPETTDKQKSLLEKAYGKLTQYQAHRWTIQELIDCVLAEDSRNDEPGMAGQALEWKLEKIARSPYFSDRDHTVLPRDLFAPGQLTVLQMNEISQEEQQVIATAILRQTNLARMNTHKQLSSPNEDDYLPFPVFILLEEAHRFAPAHEPSRCKQVLRTILSEGRKFGLGVGLITQRPGKLDADILSQCMSQFLMRIVNPTDQENLKYGVEAAGRDLLSELPALTKGQVIVSGVCVNTPVLCKVRQRLTKHGGETLDILGMWQNYHSPQAQQVRQTRSAPPAPPQASTRVNGRSID